MTPREIVNELDKYIVGQADAKRAVAIAIRNRWRRQKVESEMRKEIGPKNMMMIGPTGVGKTEIARRLATLANAPFIKVEATKYTEVGYYGRDVESMVRELVENAIGIVRADQREKIRAAAEKETEKILVDLLVTEYERMADSDSSCPVKKTQKSQAVSTAVSSETDGIPSFDELRKQIQINIRKLTNNQWLKENSNPDESDASQLAVDKFLKAVFPDSDSLSDDSDDSGDSDDSNENQEDATSQNRSGEKICYQVDREEVLQRLRSGFCEDEQVNVFTEQKAPPFLLGGIGMESMENDFQNLVEQMFPKKSGTYTRPVKEARKIIFEQQCEKMIDKEKVNAEAVELAENVGIIFIDEIDKIVSGENQHGPDVSRQGVQRDLLPIVEGTTVQTKYGFVSTEHILFIAAGAFHRAKPTDLMPELQGRFPIRVELSDLTKEDFVRILTIPKGSLTRQYQALMKTEGVDLEFSDDAIAVLAEYAFEVNQTTQNIGARRLYTIMEKMLEELAFEAPDMKMGKVVVNAAYVTARLAPIVKDEDLNRFIL